MNKKIIIIGLMIITHVINSMDFSTLGKKERCNSDERIAFVFGLSVRNYAENKLAVKREFFLQVCMNNVALVEHLLDLGIDHDVTNDYGDTALVVAIQWNAREVVELLLQRGANPLQVYKDPMGDMTLERYVELYHSDYSDLLDRYIRVDRVQHLPSAPPAEDGVDMGYLPSAPPADDVDEEYLFGISNRSSSQLQEVHIERPAVQVNTGYAAKLKSLVKNNKILSGVTLAVIAGVAYKYLYKKENKENKQTSAREL